MQIFSNYKENTRKNINYNLTKTFEKMQYSILFLILIFRLNNLWFGKERKWKKKRPILFHHNKVSKVGDHSREWLEGIGLYTPII